MDASDEDIGEQLFPEVWLEKDGEGDDFDGHTAFRSLTFTQKLAWVSEAVVSIYVLAKDNPEAECRLFFDRCQDL